MTHSENTFKRIGPALPKLPHEKDESTVTPLRPGRKMKRAAADLAAGKVDTEIRGEARCNFDPAACNTPSPDEKDSS